MSNEEIKNHIKSHVDNGDFELAIEMLWQLIRRREKDQVIINENH